MRTHFISANNFYSKCNLPQQNKRNDLYSVSSDKVCINSQNVNFTGKLNIVDSVIKKFNLNPIWHFKDFTLEEYSKLSQSQILKLRAKFDKVVKHSLWDDMDKFEKIHAIVADAMQDAFDKFFGKDNYVVVTVGRSLSSIRKALGYRIGEKNVVNVPISSAGRFVPDSINFEHHLALNNLIKKDEDLDKFLKYLKTVGLSREDVEKSGKNYILTDYCFMGNSLMGTEYLFKTDMIWGAKNKNIYTADVMRVLDNYEIGDVLGDFLKLSDKNKVDYYQIIKHALWQQRLKYCSFVGKSTKLGEASKASKSYKLDRKIFDDTREILWFKLLDNAVNAKKNGVVEVTPKNIETVVSTDGQIIPPWEDFKSMVMKNIRNDVQRVDQVATKALALGEKGENIAYEMFDLVDSIGDVYIKNPERYYKVRSDILKTIENAEKELAL